MSEKMSEKMDTAFNVRAPKEWVDALRADAAKNERSIQGTVRLAVKEYLERRGLLGK